MKNKKYKYLGKNTLIFTISSFGTKFLSFFLVPPYTNVLTTKEYGIIDIINTSGILMTYIFTLNISDAVLRFAIEQKNEHEKILTDKKERNSLKNKNSKGIFNKLFKDKNK